VVERRKRINPQSKIKRKRNLPFFMPNKKGGLKTPLKTNRKLNINV
jgi:hypothetical protein